VQANTQNQSFCTTFNFTLTHPSHPPPKKNENIFHYICNNYTTFAQI
jgi:hypothetical protein